MSRYDWTHILGCFLYRRSTQAIPIPRIIMIVSWLGVAKGIIVDEFPIGTEKSTGSLARTSVVMFICAWAYNGQIPSRLGAWRRLGSWIVLECDFPSSSFLPIKYSFPMLLCTQGSVLMSTLRKPTSAGLTLQDTVTQTVKFVFGMIVYAVGYRTSVTSTEFWYASAVTGLERTTKATKTRTKRNQANPLFIEENTVKDLYHTQQKNVRNSNVPRLNRNTQNLTRDKLTRNEMVEIVGNFSELPDLHTALTWRYVTTSDVKS